MLSRGYFDCGSWFMKERGFGASTCREDSSKPGRLTGKYGTFEGCCVWEIIAGGGRCAHVYRCIPYIKQC